MMNRLVKALALTLALVSWNTVANPVQPEINLISAAQRYPWNNMVDYTYALSNCNASATYKLAVDLTVNGVTKSVTNELTTVADGTYAGSVDMASQFGVGVKDAQAGFKIKLLGTK